MTSGFKTLDWRTFTFGEGGITGNNQNIQNNAFQGNECQAMKDRWKTNMSP